MVDGGKMVQGPAEIEWPLTGWTFATKTNIAQRKLCNRDACLLLMAANGPTIRTRVLKDLLNAWRAVVDDRGVGYNLDMGYLFNHYYGHVGTDAFGKKYVPVFSSSMYQGPCWWWRDTATMRGTVQISVSGYKRLARLVAAITAAHDDEFLDLIFTIESCLNARTEAN